MQALPTRRPRRLPRVGERADRSPPVPSLAADRAPNETVAPRAPQVAIALEAIADSGGVFSLRGGGDGAARAQARDVAKGIATFVFADSLVGLFVLKARAAAGGGGGRGASRGGPARLADRRFARESSSSVLFWGDSA